MDSRVLEPMGLEAGESYLGSGGEKIEAGESCHRGIEAGEFCLGWGEGSRRVSPASSPGGLETEGIEAGESCLGSEGIEAGNSCLGSEGLEAGESCLGFGGARGE
ncbi:hypothetical protein KY284_031010 [Solanum tuberosum]|nr:hypothetical protein KY284_031010 [Solanum tuberosum]